MDCDGRSPPPAKRMPWRVSFDSSTAATSSPSFNMAAAASPWMPPIPRMIMYGGLCLCAFFDFGPGVSQSDGPVENRLAERGVRVDAEIAETLELVLPRGWTCEGRLELGAGNDFERVRVQVRGEILPRFGLVGIFACEEIVVKADFAFHRMRG